MNKREWWQWAWWGRPVWQQWTILILGLFLTVDVLVFLVWMSKESEDPSRTPSTATTDPATFSVSTCGAAWQQLDAVSAAQLGPRSDFMAMCTSPGAKSLMCGLDPTIPDC